MDGDGPHEAGQDWLRLEIPPAWDRMRLDHALPALAEAGWPEEIPEGGLPSRSRWRGLIDQGAVVRLVPPAEAGAGLKPGWKVREGEIWQVRLPRAAPASAVLTPWDYALRVVHEDAWLAVIDKPAGMVVHPAPGHRSRTLAHALVARYGEALTGAGPDPGRPGIVHRLDRDTSGLLVIARHAASHRALAAQFATHEARRGYVALVHGVPAPASGQIDLPVGRSRTDRQRMAVRFPPQGRPATTRYRVLQAEGRACAAVWCRLQTGRTHQIRVHLAAIGHGVLADPLYGRRRTGPPGGAIGRQALHAAALHLIHPQTGQPMLFRAPIPGDLAGPGAELFQPAAWQAIMESVATSLP